MDAQVKLFVRGNIFLLICCMFYLAWWLIAFKPEGAIKGMKSGWLLIPAAACGLTAVIEIVRGIGRTDMGAAVISNTTICAAGIVLYFILLGITGAVLHRQVTTELVLIVGWATMAAAEVNTLCAAGVLRPAQGVGLCAAAAILAAISLACYLAYYKLNTVAGYWDGAVPLALVGAMTAVMLAMLR